MGRAERPPGDQIPDPPGREPSDRQRKMLVISRPIDCKRSVAPHTVWQRPPGPPTCTSPPLIPHPIFSLSSSGLWKTASPSCRPLGVSDLGFPLPGAGFPPPAARRELSAGYPHAMSSPLLTVQPREHIGIDVEGPVHACLSLPQLLPS
jgi:hypothetical protein